MTRSESDGLTRRFRWSFICMAFPNLRRARPKAAATSCETVSDFTELKCFSAKLKYFSQLFSRLATTLWFLSIGLQLRRSLGNKFRSPLKYFNINASVMQVFQRCRELSTSRPLRRKVLKIFSHIWRSTAPNSRNRIQFGGELDVILSALLWPTVLSHNLGAESNRLVLIKKQAEVAGFAGKTLKEWGILLPRITGNSPFSCHASRS